MSNASNALAFERVGEPPGIDVVDRIEQQRCTIRTPEAVDLREASAEDFQFPVGRAVEFEADEILLPTIPSVMVHDGEGNAIADIDHREEANFKDGSYSLGLSGQIKTYVEVTAAFEITSGLSELTIRFEEPTTVRLGARSLHENPAGTIVTTAAPADIMATIETFGSALKTVNPERSYPTLRGHPPAVELGDELSIPDGIASPEMGITIEVPPALESLYVVAPLTYYLGASLEPGPRPRIVTDDGFEYALDGPEGFETTVRNVLQQVFFLDCITRTEGLYQLPLAEREQVEPLVDVDFATLYDRPLSEQVAAYLDVPFRTIEEYLPEWPLTTHVEPNPEAIEQLPFIVDDLAMVRTSQSDRTVAQTVGPEIPDAATGDVLTRSASGSESAMEDSFVQPQSPDAMEQAWIGEDIPIGASKLTAAGFRNRLNRDVSDGDIEISIVLNDDRMETERDVVDEAYGNRDDLPFEVSLYRNTTVEELRELLGQQRGFLHYIGHTERDGFECSDGKLDVATLDDVGIETFLLNACNSYHQGVELIEAGAIGGIVTLVDIINTEGVNMGESVARLLNAGFPLRASLTIARDESIQGGQYIVVGDGSMSVTQPEGLTPMLLDVDVVDGEFDLTITMFTTDSAGIGTLCMPNLREAEQYHLASNHVDEFTLSRDAFRELLELEELPIRFDDELRWSSSLSVDELL